MAVDKIRASGDSRVEHRSALVNGKTYGYLYSQPPSGQYKGTVVLMHGFPDLSIGWRYQIPLFINKGYRVIAPDCLGYGRTDAPADLAAYSHKNCADDINELANQLGASKSSWAAMTATSAPITIPYYYKLRSHLTGQRGAFLVYRIALWHPTLITYLFTVHGVQSAPHLGYQLHFISGEIEKAVKSKEEHKQFLIALYGGKTQEKEPAFDVHKGVDLEKMRRVRMSGLLEEEEVEYYAWEIARHGLRGPLNWYRTRRINYDDELSLQTGTIDIPVLFIQALRDAALPPHLAKGMGEALPRLMTKQVNASHWALWEKPAEVNQALEAWIDDVVEGGSREAKL